MKKYRKIADGIFSPEEEQDLFWMNVITFSAILITVAIYNLERWDVIDMIIRFIELA